MKTLRLPFLVILITCGFLSCNKKEEEQLNNFDILVEGHLLDASNMEPIENGDVFVYRRLRSSSSGLSGGGLGSKYLEAKTNENGYYRFEFEVDNDYGYAVLSKTDGYYEHAHSQFPKERFGENPTSGSKHIQFRGTTKKDYFNFTIALIPQATIEVRVVNVTKVYSRFGMNTPPGSPIGTSLQLYGFDVDETYYYTVYGGFDWFLTTFLYKPGEGPGEGKRVDVHYNATPHDLTQILIEY